MKLLCLSCSHLGSKHVGNYHDHARNNQGCHTEVHHQARYCQSYRCKYFASQAVRIETSTSSTHSSIDRKGEDNIKQLKQGPGNAGTNSSVEGPEVRVVYKLPSAFANLTTSYRLMIWRASLSIKSLMPGWGKELRTLVPLRCEWATVAWFRGDRGDKYFM